MIFCTSHNSECMHVLPTAYYRERHLVLYSNNCFIGTGNLDYVTTMNFTYWYFITSINGEYSTSELNYQTCKIHGIGSKSASTMTVKIRAYNACVLIHSNDDIQTYHNHSNKPTSTMTMKK